MGLFIRMAVGISLIFLSTHQVCPMQYLNNLNKFVRYIPGTNFVTEQIAVQKYIIKHMIRKASHVFDTPYYGLVRKIYDFSRIILFFNLFIISFHKQNKTSIKFLEKTGTRIFEPWELLNKDPLAYAIRYKDLSVLKQITRNGVDFSATTVKKDVIDDFVCRDDAKILDCLIKAGASVHASGTSVFPIYKAIHFEQKECIRLLGRAGDIIRITKDNRDSDVYGPALECMQDMEHSTQELISAIEMQDVSKAKRAIDSWAIVVRKDQYGNTLLHRVIGPYDPKKPTNLDQIARLIVPTIGRQVRKLRNDKEQTPLHIAAMQGNVRLMQLLVRFGADVDSPDIFGNTPSHYAQDLSTVLFLVHNHADLSIQNDKGELPYQALIALAQSPKSSPIETKSCVYKLLDRFKSIFPMQPFFKLSQYSIENQ